MGCGGARGAPDEDLEWLAGTWASPTDVAGLIEQFDRVVSI
jgi:hypothetical protein